MSQVPVKWVRSKHELWDRQVQANTTSPDMAVPVVPLSALREAVEELKGAKSWLEQLANRFDFEWPNTANQCRIHARSIERLLAHLDAEGVQ